MSMHRAFPGPEEAAAMDTEVLAMCVLDRLISTPEDRRGELSYRDGFINHHVTRAFQEHVRGLEHKGVVVTRSGDARAAMPELADALLEAWAYLEREGFLIAEDRRRRVLISREGHKRHAVYRAGEQTRDESLPAVDAAAASESTERAPTAIVLWAHGDASWDAERRADWRDSVLGLAHLLADNGIDADLDLFHSHETTDWSRFGPTAIRRARWIVVAVSDAWRRAFEGENDPTANAGAVAEANALRGLFQSDQSEFSRRVVLVLLPGVQSSDVPQELRATTPWVRIPTFTRDGLEELLRILHGLPAYPKPAVGAAPELAPYTPGTSQPGGRQHAGDAGHRREIDPPELEPVDYPTGTFNLHMPNGPLSAHLTNRGGCTAEIVQARLSTFLGEFDGEMWAEQPAPLAPERGPSADLSRAGRLTIAFGDGQLGALIQNPEPLTLNVRYRGAGRPELYEYSVKLHRAAASPSARPQWRAKSPQTVVVA